MVVYEDTGSGMVHAYSDAGLMLSGGFPEGLYPEAYDPVGAERTYVETDDYVPTDPIPPERRYRTFSKLSLEQILFEKGLLDAVDAFIDSQTVTNEKGQTAPLRRFYNTAVVLRENHPLFSGYKDLLQRTLGLSDRDVEAILSRAVAT